MSYPAVIQLPTLDGTYGFIIPGPAGFENLGASVSSAGDINNDGIADFIIGARGADSNGESSGAAYVVFGRAGGFGAALDLSTLDGSNGFRIEGATAYDALGASVAGAGDFNSDGIDDLIIGADLADPNGLQSGAAYILFGQNGAFAPAVQVSTLNGFNGLKLHGEIAGGTFGVSVASAGDFNGDGLGDVIVGAYNAGLGGQAYVVFGVPGFGLGAQLEASALSGANGFQINAANNFDRVGFSVDGAGDVNGDGFSDLIVSGFGADVNGNYSGAAYVIFGRANEAGPEFDVASLDGTNGFRLEGPHAFAVAGYSVAAAGDVNGDGYADLIVGATSANGTVASSGTAYVVFGKANGFAPSLNLGALNGTDGFRLSGVTTGERTGFSVSSAGDINGDGLADLIVSARDTGGNAGASWVVLGRAAGFGSNLDLSSLDGEFGFRINGGAAFDFAVNVSSAGDVNDDGFDDLIVGASGVGGNAGAAYIILGRSSQVNFTGTAAAETQYGGFLDDTIRGLGGNDLLYGRSGSDTLEGGDGQDRLYGGEGGDILVGGAGNDNIWGEAGNDALYANSGANKLFGGAGDDYIEGGSGNDRLDGGEDNDTLVGGAGNDFLDGGAGFNIMRGGAGNDIYMVRSGFDGVIEDAGAGLDTIRTALTDYGLAPNIENLEFLGVQDTVGYGNDLNNRLTGNVGDNTLHGYEGADILIGGDGDDILIGGLGKDTLTGGAGADTFRYLQESIGRGGSELDNITDFSAPDGDLFDFSAIDADSISDGDQAFTLARGGFTRSAGEMVVIYVAGQNQTVIRLDVDGDGLADLQLRVSGDVTGETAGWLL
jgi:hypothetical protein